MRTLKRIIPVGLVLAALAVVFANAFRDHSSDYGQVALPQGGVVELPEGTVKVFYKEGGVSSEAIELDAPLRFQVTPAAGGEPLEQRATAGDADGEELFQRSQDLDEVGSVAEIEVPAAGSHLVRGDSRRPPGTTSLSFGTDPFSAVVDKWRLLAALLAAALLILLVPVGRRRGPQGVETTWSSDPRTPYA